MDESSISDKLNKVWAEFRKGGITDDIVIIGQVTEILLAIQGKPNPVTSSNA